MATVILLNVFVGNIVSIHKQIERLPDVIKGLLGFTLLVSGISACRNLREEPLTLLSGNEQD